MAASPIPGHQPAGDTLVTPLTAAEVMGLATREYIIVAGKDGVGKSCAVVAMAWFVQNVLNPDAKFFVIDTENKFPTAMKSFGDSAPTNIVYFKCENANDVTNAMEYIMKVRKMGDWVAMESLGRMWTYAQDLAYGTISGYTKAVYLEKRKLPEFKGANVIPSPDRFWDIANGSHNGGFIDQLAQAMSLNVMLTTTISKPPKEGGRFKENEVRKQARVEFGIDQQIDGAPRVPYYAETFCMMETDGIRIKCRVLRDNQSAKPDDRPTFYVTDKKSFGMDFWTACR